MSEIKNCTSVPEGDIEGAFGRNGPASFGDEGLTATANAYGNLIHITRYTGGDPCDQSKFICADFAQSTEHSQNAQHADSDPELRHLHLLNRMSTAPQTGCRLGTLYSEGADVRDSQVPQMLFLHNRWPLFKIKTNSGFLNVQYFIHNGVVYQRYTHEVCKSQKNEGPAAMALRGQIRLLGIDFADEANGIVPHLYAKHLSPYRPRDSDSASNASSDTSTDDGMESDDGISVFDVLKNTPASSESTASVPIWLFVGDRQHSFSIQQSGRSISVDNLFWDEALSAGQLDLTLAYALRAESSEEILDISRDDMLYVKTQLSKHFEAPRIVEDQNLNFVILRNVEHILSVCSIAVFHQDKVSANWPRRHSEVESQRPPPVVLTCGDVARHRVVTQASFHSFRLLLWALDKFKTHAEKEEANRKNCMWKLASVDETDSCVNSIYCKRISAVCSGHIEWLCHYWPTNIKVEKENGSETIEKEKEEESKNDRKLQVNYKENAQKEDDAGVHVGIDMALQIIKLGEIADSTAATTSNTGSAKRLVKSWLEGLSKTKRDGLPMISRSENELKRFDLVDHALVWWAMRSVEKLGWNPTLSYDPLKKPEKQISPQEFQESILKRFTTENTTIKTRMLARSRSLVEMDFILGPKDTTLFYADRCGFFTKASSYTSSAWKNTLDCQKYSDDNEESEWNRPLDFGLAVILCSLKIAVKSSEEPATMYKSMLATLFKQSSPNGLSAGQFGWFKEDIFSMNEQKHDSYWSTQFEIPYILSAFPSSKPENGTADDLSKVSNLLERSLDKRKAESKEDVVMKQRLPFGDYIGLKHIVELRDRWLYDEPKFLNSQPTIPEISVKAFRKLFKDEKNIFFKATIVQACIDQLAALEVRRSEPRRALDPDLELGPGLDRLACIVSDVGGADVLFKSKQNNSEGVQSIMQHPHGTQRDYEKEHVKTLDQLRERLIIPRSRDYSKKRLLQFYHIEPTAALVCCLASPVGDMVHLANFFRRHVQYETYHFDEAVKITNSWITEVHLSFWVLGKRSDRQEHASSSSANSNFAKEDWTDFPHAKPKPNQTRKKANNGSSSRKCVQRASVSFRFDGDFLDRYWTCHFIQHRNVQKQETTNAEAGETGERDSTKSVAGSNKEPSPKFATFDIRCQRGLKHKWEQRRVLELVLLHRALELIVDAAAELLKEAKTTVQNSFLSDKESQSSPSSSSKPSSSPPSSSKDSDLNRGILAETLDLLQTESSDDYVSASNLCHKVQYLLRVLQENLAENLKITQQWSDRENKRECPQWTKKDEHRYRREISKWQTLNDQKVLELQKRHDQIRSYNDLLTRKLEDIRTELEIRGSDGIRLFTYITVVFVPIGFGMGLFSMSEVPSVFTLVCMIGASLVTLLLTVVVLAKAKVLESELKEPIKLFARFFAFVWRWSPFGLLWRPLKEMFKWLSKKPELGEEKSPC